MIERELRQGNRSQQPFKMRRWAIAPAIAIHLILGMLFLFVAGYLLIGWGIDPVSLAGPSLLLALFAASLAVVAWVTKALFSQIDRRVQAMLLEILSDGVSQSRDDLRNTVKQTNFFYQYWTFDALSTLLINERVLVQDGKYAKSP